MAKGLIDADKLHEAVQRAMGEYDGCGLYDRLVLSGLVTADALIAFAHTVDAVEVCYCRDCRYARPLNDTEKLTYLDERKVCYNGDAAIDGYNIVMPEHFCSYGERKEE